MTPRYFGDVLRTYFFEDLDEAAKRASGMLRGSAGPLNASHYVLLIVSDLDVCTSIIHYLVHVDADHTGEQSHERIERTITMEAIEDGGRRFLQAQVERAIVDAMRGSDDLLDAPHRWEGEGGRCS